MPGLTGVDVLKYLDRRHISIPTVVITAHDSEESREACLNAGALAYLPKPLDAGQLVAAIVKICEASSAGRAGS
jgi:two-component system sensor histidine kinase RpfC